MNRFDITIIGYSLLLLVGGIIGYLVAGSVASLLMSSIFALLLIGALFLIRVSPHVGMRGIMLLLAALTLFFAYRWYAGKFVPSGILFFATLGILLYTCLHNKQRGL